MQTLEFASKVVAPFQTDKRPTIRRNQSRNRIFEKQMSLIEKNINEMQQQVEEFRATTDVIERRTLMQAHRRFMQDSLYTMHQMRI